MASIKQAGSEDGRVSPPSSSQFITGITALWCLGLFIGTRRNSLTYLGLQIAGTDLAVGAGRLFSTVQEIDWVGHVGSAPTMLSKTTSQTTSSGTLSVAGVCGKTGSTTGASAIMQPGETRTKRTISGGVIRVRSDDEVSVVDSVPGVPMEDLTAEIDLDLTDLVGIEIDDEVPDTVAPNFSLPGIHIHDPEWTTEELSDALYTNWNKARGKDLETPPHEIDADELMPEDLPTPIR